MISALRTMLRDARYALPKQIERVVRGPGMDSATRRCRKLERDGRSVTVGYFQSEEARPAEIFSANLSILQRWQSPSGGSYLSVKAPPLHFDLILIRTLAASAADLGLPLLFDSHAPSHADATLATTEELLAEFPATGFALPARWRRSRTDASRFRESTARIRLVKGEWPDPDFADDIARSYLDLIARLAGRKAPVSVATHDPEIAERALLRLIEAGTPCELELLRGLPRRRTMAVAERLGVPVRYYVPFGPGWWPYALDKALARPYLLSWAIRDWLQRPRAKPVPSGA